MRLRQLKHRLACALLALSLAWVAGGALAHELDHELHQHDLPCALHFYAGHLDGLTAAGVALPIASLQSTVAPVTAAEQCLPRPAAPYAVRAPPRFS